jgi:hypothetical protein
MAGTKVSVTLKDKNERDNWREHATKRGFDGNLAGYLRWLVRRDMAKDGEIGRS